MINKEEVKHIAHLARLGISKGEIEKFQGELSAILDFVEKLQKVDVSGVEPMAQATESKNVFRKDQAKKSKAAFRQTFLKNLPQREGDHIKVPPILE